MAFSFTASSRSVGSRRSSRRPLGTRRRRLSVALALVVAAAVTGAFTPSVIHAATFVGPKYYYLALGDSLAFGYQPNFSWSHSYAAQWYSNLQQHGSKSYTNYGCNGETSATFINGGCPYAFLLHNYYAGAQLNAAVAFIKKHAGSVSPVSLDMGANDLLPDINLSTCSVSANWNTDLANVDARMTATILPQLTAALSNNSGTRTGDLVMMNYYDPYQNQCPNSVAYVEQLNQHLASDAAQFGVPVSDVVSAFGGATVPDPNTCNYTWVCSSYHDIHATTTGYGVIAGAFEAETGY